MQRETIVEADEEITTERQFHLRLRQDPRTEINRTLAAGVPPLVVDCWAFLIMQG
jgi:hypothetical protein